MKVSINWLKELVDLKVSLKELISTINLKTIGTREVTDRFIELDMKGYNRADLLSLRGVAYEVSAISNSKVLFNEPKDSDYLWVEQNLPKTRVEIKDEDLASVQAVAKIEGLKVGNSSKEWISKLEDSGMRSVNNIVDATNLIMLEYGHPLHAFSADKVKDDTIVVRRAKKDEQITTLDGKKRVLGIEDIVLADDEKALDVAGVMGGKDTEVTGSTNTILLSASLFNPEMVRHTANSLGLQSEASKRFYHGLTKKRLLQALEAAIKIYTEQLGGKLTTLNIVGDTSDQLQKIPLSLEKVNSLVGIEFKAEEVEEYLKRLNFGLKRVTDESWVVTVPYYRLDVEIEEDLIEEIARMYGYEKIPAKKLEGTFPDQEEEKLFENISKIRQALVKNGLTEVQTYSFFSTAVLKSLGWEGDNLKYLVKIANPMSSETEYMKQDSWPNLLEAAARNIKKGEADFAVFEFSKAFYPQKGNLPLEQHRISILIADGSGDELKQAVAFMAVIEKELGIKLEVEKAEIPAQAKHLSSIDKLSLFHPVRSFFIKKDGQLIGGLGEVHPRVVNKFGIDKRVAFLELQTESL